MPWISMRRLGHGDRFWWADPAKGFERPGLYIVTKHGKQVRLFPARKRLH